MLTLPRVKFYAYFVREQNDNKTPSYVMTKRFGEYAPIEFLKPSRGKYKGLVRFYLNAHDKRTSNLRKVLHLCSCKVSEVSTLLA